MAQAPRFLDDDVPDPPLPWRSWLLLALLLLVLVVQVIVADRARLAADPAWRPTVRKLCGWLQCDVPPWVEPDAFRVTAREVRPHPSAPGVLLVTASFRNDAAFGQRWPLLELSLSDLDGHSLGRRRFTPEEYLGREPERATIASGQSASIALEVLDPGKRAVAFDFEFR